MGQPALPPDALPATPVPLYPQECVPDPGWGCALFAVKLVLASFWPVMYFLPSIFLLFTDSPYSFNLANRKGRGQGHARKGGERRSLERCGGNGGDGWHSGQVEMRWTKQIVHVGVLLPAAAFMQNSFKLMLGEGSLPWLRHRGKLGEAGLVFLWYYHGEPYSPCCCISV